MLDGIQEQAQLVAASPFLPPLFSHKATGGLWCASIEPETLSLRDRRRCSRASRVVDALSMSEDEAVDCRVTLEILRSRWLMEF